MKNIRWLFFDIGSTLVDEQLAYDHRIRDMIQGTNLTFSEVHAKRIELARQGLDGNAAVITHYKLNKTPWHTEDESLYAQTPTVLEKLVNQGFHLGVLANQLPGLQERLAAWGIAKYFTVIVSSSELGIAKPNPAIFEKALAMAGCTPAEAVMIGDRLDNDILPAKQCQMHTIWLRSGMSAFQPPELGTPHTDAMIDTLSELPNVLHEIIRRKSQMPLGREVTVLVDRPLGSFHPQHPDLYYPVNYGYIPGLFAPDGEEQDAYILGLAEPVERFTGQVIAILRRKNDVEDKWVVAPAGAFFSEAEIRAATHFQEQFFEIAVEIL